MKVLLAGGGTGGHINPAIAIANEIKAARPDTEFLFAAVPGGMEDTLIPKAGYPVSHIKVSGFNRSFLPQDILHNIKSAGYLAMADSRAKKMVREFSPDLVIGTGGFLCGPVVLAAQKLGVPSYLHEQNAFPGVTIKLLAKRATMVFLAFEEAKKHLPEGKEYQVVGNPVRQSFMGIGKKEAREKLGLDDHFTILSFGGSSGATAINKMAADLMEWHCEKGEINHLHGFGKLGREKFPALLAERKLELSRYPRIRASEYIDNIHLCLAAADVVISRAGAVSISELEVMGTPSVLVPYPYATENHQYYNAKVLADHGAAVVVEEKDYKKELLIEQLNDWLSHPEKLVELSKNASQLAVMDTTKQICDRILTDQKK